MKAFANPILLLIIIALLVQHAVGGAELGGSAGMVTAWTLALCLTGLLVNGALALARAVSHRPGVLVLGIWSCIYLVLGSCAWVFATELDEDAREEQQQVARMEESWRSGEVSPFARNDEGVSLLAMAAASGGRGVALVQELLALPQAAENREELCRAALAAAGAGRRAGLELLLDHGVPADAECDGQLLLHAAVLGDHVDTADYLLGRGAKVDAADAEGNTALMHAALNGNVPMVKLLLKRGANPALQNQEGRDAASLAANDDVEQLLEPAN